MLLKLLVKKNVTEFVAMRRAMKAKQEELQECDIEINQVKND